MHHIIQRPNAARVLVAIVVVIGSASGMSAQSKAQSDKCKGVPFDVEFVKNKSRAQVILQKTPDSQLVATTSSEPLQRILLVALMLKHEVEVQYSDPDPGDNLPKLTAVTLDLNPKKDEGRVFKLSLDEKNKYEAVVFSKGKGAIGWTNSPQMQAVLETAARESIPVRNFSVDKGTMEILTAQVLIPLAKKK